MEALGTIVTLRLASSTDICQPVDCELLAFDYNVEVDSACFFSYSTSPLPCGVTVLYRHSRMLGNCSAATVAIGY